MSKDAEKTKCIKCGERAVSVWYHVGGYDTGEVGRKPGPRCGLNDINSDHGEHLHYKCSCGYDWTLPTLDSVFE